MSILRSTLRSTLKSAPLGPAGKGSPRQRARSGRKRLLRSRRLNASYCAYIKFATLLDCLVHVESLFPLCFAGWLRLWKMSRNVEGCYSNSRRSALDACSIGLGFVQPKVGNSPELVRRPGPKKPKRSRSTPCSSFVPSTRHARRQIRSRPELPPLF
jgi:hypothetical protein